MTTKPETDAEERDPVRDAVQTIAELHRRSEEAAGTHQKLIERLTGQLGRPGFFYTTLVAVVIWIGINLFDRVEGWPSPDTPPFYWLQGFVGLSALLTTTMVLITQNRQDRAAERRAQLDLQISILIEQKVTKLIALVEELRSDLPEVQDRRDPEAERMTQNADVVAVVEELDRLLDATDEALGTNAPAEKS